MNLGWKRDKPSDDDRHISERLGLSLGSVPESASIRQHVISVLDQGGVQSCVSNAVAQAIRICQRVQGVQTPPLLSRLALYSWARAFDGEQTIDGGTRVRNAWLAMAKLGFPRETAWPYDEAAVNQPVPLEAVRESVDQRYALGGFFRIPSVGASLASYIRKAITEQHPVVFGTRVDNAIMTLPAGTYYRRTSPEVGGHALCIVGYTPDGVEVANSWGPLWSDGGFGLVSWEQILSDDADDFWVPTLAPLLDGAA